MPEGKEIPEGFIKEPEKAERMARAENVYRILGENALEIGNLEFGKELLAKAGEEAEKAASEWESREQQVNMTVEETTRKILEIYEEKLKGDPDQLSSPVEVPFFGDKEIMTKVIERLKHLFGVQKGPRVYGDSDQERDYMYLTILPGFFYHEVFDKIKRREWDLKNARFRVTTKDQWNKEKKFWEPKEDKK